MQAAKSSVQVLVPGHATTTETPTGEGRSALIKVIERMQEDKSTNFVTVEGGVDQTTPTQQEVENLGDGEFKVSAYTHIRKKGRNGYEVKVKWERGKNGAEYEDSWISIKNIDEDSRNLVLGDAELLYLRARKCAKDWRKKVATWRQQSRVGESFWEFQRPPSSIFQTPQRLIC